MPLFLVWPIFPFAVQEAMGNPNQSSITVIPEQRICLTKGKRPPAPGGVFYRQNWGGFWGSVSSLAFSKDGKYLLSAGSSPTDNTIRLWDAKSGEELRRYEASNHSSQYESVSFSPSGQFVLAGSRKSTGSAPHMAWIWNTDTTIEIQRYVGEHNTHYVGGVESQFSPNGENVLTACLDGPAILWNTITGTVIRKFGTAVKAAAFSPSGEQVVTGSGCGYIAIWNKASGRKQLDFSIHDNVMSIDFSPDGERLLARSFKTAYYINAATGEIIHQFDFEYGIGATAISPDGVHLIIGSTLEKHDHLIHCAILYDLATGEKTKILEETESLDDSITSISFSPDGRHIAVGSWYGPIRLWDIETGKQIRAFYGHIGSGPNVEFLGEDTYVNGSHIGSIKETDSRIRRRLIRIYKQQKQTLGYVFRGDEPVFPESNSQPPDMDLDSYLPKTQFEYWKTISVHASGQ